VLTVTGADLQCPLSLAARADRSPGTAARALIVLTRELLV
jgi:hypothetical protein